MIIGKGFKDMIERAEATDEYWIEKGSLESAENDAISECLRKLDEEGATGLDLSPGNALAREAAEIIRHLMKCLGR